MRRTFTIQAKAVEKIVKHAAECGVEASRLYEAVGFDADPLRDADSRIPFAQLVELYEQAALLTGDENFGLHVGEAIEPKVFDALGYIALNSPTLRDAFERVARYHSIWTDGAAFELKRGEINSAIQYRYLDQSLMEHRQDSEMTLATVVAVCRSVVDPKWTPLAVEFQHEKPAGTSAHQRIFQCDIKFAERDNKLVFDSATLNQPIAKADPELSAVLSRHAEQLLSLHPNRESLVDQVKSLIISEFHGGDPSLEGSAAQLGLTARTLQRKLRDQGTSYHELLDQLRQETALRYMQNPKMSICEVAYLLGFSEPSSFHRAFRRWTGKTPKQFGGE